MTCSGIGTLPTLVLLFLFIGVIAMGLCHMLLLQCLMCKVTRPCDPRLCEPSEIVSQNKPFLVLSLLFQVFCHVTINLIDICSKVNNKIDMKIPFIDFQALQLMSTT